MSLEDMQSNQGDMFAWADMFWSGCKVGLGIGLCGFGVGVVVGFVAVAALYYVIKNIK